MANDKTFKPTPQDAIQGGVTPEIQGVANPFETPSREGFATYILDVAKTISNAVQNGEFVNLGTALAVSYGEEIANKTSDSYRRTTREYPLDAGRTIRIVYDNYLEEENKILFRQAIGDAVYSLVNNSSGNVAEVELDVVKSIVISIAEMRAIESVGSMIKAMGSNSLNKSQKDDFYAIGIATLNSLPDPSNPNPELFAIISKFLESPYFDESYLFQMITTLIYTDPSQIEEILGKYEPRLVALREKAKLAGEDIYKAGEWWLEDLQNMANVEIDPQVLEKARTIAGL
jgi:hypothetical protein